MTTSELGSSAGAGEQSLGTQPPRERLMHEARLLADLLTQHVEDRRRAQASASQPIYFIDAHELKAYLHASGKESYMEGFVLQAEETLLALPENAHLDSYLRLKSEQMLHWLLFDYPGQVVVLPSHGAEIDDEIGYRSHHLLVSQLGLIAAAKTELLRLRRSALSAKLLTKFVEEAEAGDERSKLRLLQDLEEYAPALSALVRGAPDVMQERIDALLTRSNLVALEDVNWESFGLDASACAAIRELRMDEALADTWMESLADERGNTFQANRLDAAAIAFLTSLNLLLQDQRQNAHAVLVTRAMTLISLIRQNRLAHELQQAAGDLLRHSRLVIIAPNDARGQSSRDGADEDSVATALSQLSLVLDTYQKQLAAGTAGAGKAGWSAEARSLVEAWHRFEAARYTMELSRDGPGAPAIDDRPLQDLRILLRWLKNDEEIESMVVDRLTDGVWAFRQRVFAGSWEPGGPDLRLRVSRSPRHGRLRIQPAEVQHLGPVEFEAPAGDVLAQSATWAEVIGFEGLLRVVGQHRNVAEDYLVCAFRHACAKRWSMAAIYADSAVRSASLLRARATEGEARLLFAQATRMEIGRWEAGEELRRVRRARAVLEESELWTRDPRCALEGAALTLELMLGNPEATRAPSQFNNGIDDLRNAYVKAARDGDTKVRIAELALLYLIAAKEKLKYFDDKLDSLLLHVREWHGEVVRGLEQLRRSESFVPEMIARRTLGAEIAGYDVIRELASASRSEAGAGDMPSEIRVDIHDLQAELRATRERSSDMVAAILQKVSVRTEFRRDYNLAYAPVWSGTETGKLFAHDIRNGAVRAAALQASQLVHQIGERQGVVAEQADDLEQLERARSLFDQAIERSGSSLTGDARFHLGMERCYACLLISNAVKDPDARRRCLEALARDYESMREEYPLASVLHFRYSVVLSELGRNAEAFQAIKDAMKVINEDNYINKDHWVTSTIVRRMGYHFANQAREVSDQLKAHPDDAELRKQYLRNLEDAFRTLYDGFDESRSAKGLLAGLETHRRLNNLVYYAILYLEAGGRVEDLAPDFRQHKLLAYIARLQPTGIDHVSEWIVLHTIGHAYHVLGLAADARRAADRLWQVVSRVGTSMQSVGIRNALDDALTWKQVDPAARATTGF